MSVKGMRVNSLGLGLELYRRFLGSLAEEIIVSLHRVEEFEDSNFVHLHRMVQYELITK